MQRQITSSLMLFVFLVLCVSGILSFFTEYTRYIATVHTIFGFTFTIVAMLHLLNNSKALKKYLKSWIVLPLLVLIAAVLYMAITENLVMHQILDYGARSKASYGVHPESQNYSEIEMSLDQEVQLSFELKRAEHFWHPQIAVWTEDTLGNYLETLYVTKATAKGIFSGGRTKDNFKTLDTEIGSTEDGYRRVNALPVWSHKRNVLYEDGLFAPTYEDPLPDGITGATPLDNFLLKSSVDYTGHFVVKLEINVAFDDNEFYSEFDFADDSVFHNGTGQLGQPSIVYSSSIDLSDKKNYTIMKMEGHGHYSGKNGKIFDEIATLTTALEIIEYIVVGYKT